MITLDDILKHNPGLEPKYYAWAMEYANHRDYGEPLHGMRWVGNVPRATISPFSSAAICNPRATEHYTVAELLVKGLVGLYKYPPGE